jgi:hypothetical protein
MPLLKEIIVVPGNATGDLFGLCTALLLKPDVGVLILQEVEVGPRRAMTPPPLGSKFDTAITGDVARPDRLLRTNGKEEYVGIEPLTNDPVFQPVLDAFDIIAEDPRGNDKSRDIAAFLEFVLGPSGQVFMYRTANVNHFYGALTRGFAAARSSEVQNVCIGALDTSGQPAKLAQRLTASGDWQDVKNGQFQPIGRGTSIVGSTELTREELIKLVRGAWRLRPPSTNDIPYPFFLLYLRQRVFSGSRTFPEGRYIALWSRFSGKAGGPHPQHDTSYTGLNQLIALAQSKGLGVILAGDRARPGVTTKGLDRQTIGNTPATTVLDFREIWKDPSWRTGVVDQLQNLDDKRLLQIKLFDYLSWTLAGGARPNRQGGVVHLGMRSGNLEAFSLIGHRVHYMEEAGNRETARMAKWHSLPQKNGPLRGPRYDLIEIQQPPTRTGKYIVEMQRAGSETPDNHIAPWADQEDAGERSRLKDPLVQKYAKGFIDADLTTIGGVMEEIARQKLTLEPAGFYSWPRRTI